MSRTTLRQNIATEAARLLVQQRAQDVYSARKKAARQFSRRRVNPAEMPSNSEIQEQVLALSGVYREERRKSLLLDMRMAAAELMRVLEGSQSRVRGDVLLGRVEAGAEISLAVSGENVSLLTTRLREMGVGYLSWDEPADGREGLRGRVNGLWRYPFTVEVYGATAPIWNDEEQGDGWDLEKLERLIAEEKPGERPGVREERNPEGEEGAYHPELQGHLLVLLQRLESVRLDPRRHPEGDLSYHSLQVFELGRERQPYDEEFLLACLLHDVGYGLDRRHPQRALMQGVENLLTERTTFLLEHHPEGIEYLSSGKIRPSLRKSGDFDDLILLAKCDLEGRVRGAIVPTVEEALDYIFGLEGAWDGEEAEGV